MTEHTHTHTHTHTYTHAATLSLTGKVMQHTADGYEGQADCEIRGHYSVCNNNKKCCSHQEETLCSLGPKSSAGIPFGNRAILKQFQVLYKTRDEMWRSGLMYKNEVYT